MLVGWWMENCARCAEFCSYVDKGLMGILWDWYHLDIFCDNFWFLRNFRFFPSDYCDWVNVDQHLNKILIVYSTSVRSMTFLKGDFSSTLTNSKKNKWLRFLALLILCKKNSPEFKSTSSTLNNSFQQQVNDILVL